MKTSILLIIPKNQGNYLKNVEVFLCSSVLLLYNVNYTKILLTKGRI